MERAQTTKLNIRKNYIPNLLTATTNRCLQADNSVYGNRILLTSECLLGAIS